MRRPLGDVCLDIASFARERKHEFLSYILRLAAAEAYKSAADDDVFELPAPSPLPRRLAARELIIGIWDLDIGRDRLYLDDSCARFLDIDPVVAARGFPNMAYLDIVHPDDVGRVRAAVAASMRRGGACECEYRLVRKDRVCWVLARGSCTRDRNGRAVRLTGAIIDITPEKTMH